MGDSDRVVVLEGGETRNEDNHEFYSLYAGRLWCWMTTHCLSHMILCARCLTHRIIEENIEYGQKYDAVDTVIPATDTIVASENGEIISDVPDRSKMYQGQTPQTFRAKKLKDLYYSLSDEEKGILTDASKIFVMKGEKVHLVQGEVFNIKITYPYDLRVAESLIRNGEMDK